jgi:TRAP-type mannitol/chloroaromatic compound transport system permease small subunit
MSFIDRLSDLTGRATAWLTLVMTLVTFVVVVLRYAFDAGYIWIQESVTWMHALVFMLGAAYALRYEEHVRVDIFYRRMTPRGRAWVDAAGVILFLFPLCAYIAFESWDFVKASWAIREASRESGGLPYPFVPLLKSVLLVMPVLLALQGLSLLVRSVGLLRRRDGAA